MGGVLSNVPIPAEDAIAQARRVQFKPGQDALEGHITRPWLDFFTWLTTFTSTASVRAASAGVTAQTASIAATDIGGGALPGGVYIFSYYLSITVAAGASNVTVTLDWTSDGIARSYVAPVALDGGVLTNSQGWCQPIRIDGASPVRYSTVIVGGCTYALDVTLEQVSV